MFCKQAQHKVQAWYKENIWDANPCDTSGKFDINSVYVEDRAGCISDRTGDSL